MFIYQDIYRQIYKLIKICRLMQRYVEIYLYLSFSPPISFQLTTISEARLPLLFFTFIIPPSHPPQLPTPTLSSVISNSIVGQYLRLSRERPGFESPLESFLYFYIFWIYREILTRYPYKRLYGGVAQMVEHSLCMRGARGSIPRTSIFFYLFTTI